jgi:glutaredoxin
MNIKNLFKKDEIIVYTSENCPYCKNTKEKLDEAKINYKEKDIRKNEKDWNDLVNLTNMPVTPAVHYMDRYLFPSRDFPNPDILVKILQNFQRLDYNIALQSLERVKTLNYHINIAFGKLDQKLQSIEAKLEAKQSKPKKVKSKKKKNVNKSTD